MAVFKVLISLFCFFGLSTANLYDPHKYPSTGPYFEGWYIRITDDSNSRSVALLFGKVLPKDTARSAKTGFVGFLKTDENGKLQSYDAFPEPNEIQVTVKDGRQVVRDPDTTSPANFKWSASPYGYIKVTQKESNFEFKIGNVTFSAKIGEPKDWSIDGKGPEGWLNYLPLPLAWFVFSLGSDVSYKWIEDVGGKKQVLTGRGLAHMEKNWGRSFPTAWIWAEGVRASDHVSFAMSGGPVNFGPIPVRGHLIGYRNPQKDIAFDFRPDNSILSWKMNACEGWLNLTVYSPLQKLEVSISGEPKLYSKCLFGPMENGFRQVCRETFNAKSHIKAYKRSFLTYSLIDEQSISLSALEFGGNYMCNSQPCVNQVSLKTNYVN